MPQGSNLVDLTGQRFGRLFVTGRGAPYYAPGSPKAYVTWACTCDCGALVEKPPGHLRSGRVTSCGHRCPLRVVPLADRLWARVDRNGPVPAHRPALGPCWPWLGSKDDKGYGRINVGPGVAPQGTDEVVKVPRVVFYLEHGRWPDPQALHHCDNPPCARPSHIFEGTAADNTADMMRKGRGRNQCGPTRPVARLT